MSNQLWDDVAAFVEASRSSVTAPQTARHDIGEAEVFTPTPLVIDILRYSDLSLFRPGQTVIDPACGDGQFLVAAKGVKVLHHGMTSDEALQDLFGVDIVRANVDACRERLGGGTIVLGNSLHPDTPIPGQTDWDRKLMLQLFPATTRLTRRTRKRRAPQAQGTDVPLL